MPEFENDYFIGLSQQYRRLWLVLGMAKRFKFMVVMHQFRASGCLLHQR
jgi:hypothetical protein